MKRSTLFAAVVFALLLVGTVITLKQKPERGISRISLAEVDTATIDRIEVSGDKAVELSLDAKDETGETWRLQGGKEANADAVKTVLSNINKITSSDLVTRDEERFAELEVDAEKGARVTAYAGSQRVAEFVVGSNASGGGTHIRLGDEVYRVKGVYRHAFAKPASSWQQLKLFTQMLADVTRVQVQLADAPTYELVKKGNDFELEQPADGPALVPADFRFDKSAARSLASNLVNLRAKEILDKDPGVEVTKLDDSADRLRLHFKGTKDAGASSPEGGDKGKPAAELAAGQSAEVAATADSGDASGQGDSLELIIGAETDAKDGTAYAKVAGRDDVVLLQKYSVQSLRKKATDLRDLKLLELDTAKVKKLSISRDKMRLDLEKQGTQWKIAKSTEKIPDDFELDPSAITRRITQLSSARAARLADTQAVGPAGLKRPKATVEATLDDGKVVSLVFGAETKDDDKEMVVARGNVDGNLYLANKWTYTNLTGGLDTFKTKPEPGGLAGMDPKALSGLPPDVRKSLEQQMQQTKREQEMLKTIQAKMANTKKNAEK